MSGGKREPGVVSPPQVVLLQRAPISDTLLNVLEECAAVLRQDSQSLFHVEEEGHILVPTGLILNHRMAECLHDGRRVAEASAGDIGIEFSVREQNCKVGRREGGGGDKCVCVCVCDVVRCEVCDVWTGLTCETQRSHRCWRISWRPFPAGRRGRGPPSWRAGRPGTASPVTAGRAAHPTAGR